MDSIWKIRGPIFWGRRLLAGRNGTPISLRFVLTLICVFLQSHAALGEDWESIEKQLQTAQMNYYEALARARWDGLEVEEMPEYQKHRASVVELSARLLEAKSEAGALELESGIVESVKDWPVERTEALMRRLSLQVDAARRTRNADLIESSTSQLRRVRLAYVEKRRPSLAPEEQALKEHWRELQASSPKPEEFLADLQKQLGSLSEADRGLLASAKRPADLEEGGLSSRLKPAFETLQKFDAQNVAFQDAYDAFNLGKIDYLMASYMEMAERVFEATYEDLSPKDKLKAAEKHGLLREYYSHYHSRRASGTMETDKFFLSPVKPFFKEMETFAEITSKPYTRNPSGLWNRVKKSFRRLTGPELTYAVNLLPNFPGFWGRLKRKEPVVDYTVDAIQRWGKLQGYRTRTVGQENLPAQPEPGGKEVVIYSPNHIHALLDSVTSVKQLEMKNRALFSGAMDWAKPWLRKMLIENPDFIVVGQGGKNPLARFAELNQTQGTTGAHLLPEGNLQSGVAYEMRALQEGYAKGVIGLLRRKGFRITVVPSTAPNNFSFLDDAGWWNRREQKELVTQIHKPITPEVIDLMLVMGDPKMLNHLIRANYMQSLETYGQEGRFLGMPDVEELIPDLNSRLIPKAQCQGTFGEVAEGMRPIVQ